MRTDRWPRTDYGLLIHDAYRPWQVTKLFWEATPDSGRIFVADPAKGSKHNRGAAVDLTLYDLATGKPVKMVGGYDEFSPRSFPDYPGGTVTRALAPRAVAAGDGGRGLHGQRIRVVALRPSRLDGVSDLEPTHSRSWRSGRRRSDDLVRRSLVVGHQAAYRPTSQSGQSRRMASLAARASRAKVRISGGSATQPSSGSWATRSKACEADVVQRQVPPFGQLGQLVAQTEETGTFERSAGGKWERDGLKLRRQIDAAAFFAQGGQVGNRVGTQLVDRAPLEIGPARVGELTVMEGRRSFPFSLGAEGVVENLGHFLGELILKRASSAPDGER